MQLSPECLFDQSSDERQMLDVISCGNFSRSQRRLDFCKDLLLYLRVQCQQVGGPRKGEGCLNRKTYQCLNMTFYFVSHFIFYFSCPLSFS